MHKLVVVESPTKAKTIRKFLPNSFQVEASWGHVRDLPSSAKEIPAAYKKYDWANLGVNVEKDYEPIYVIPKDKSRVIKTLKEALKNADELYIATDEDREGESIGWHLLKVLKPKVPVKRMVFHEITKSAILNALEDTREIDASLVDAQETRRVLDRLVGYTVSPLLWRKIAPKLSAGRVQSVAVRLLVMRERERLAFVNASYWGLKATLDKSRTAFEATLTALNGTRLAIGKDFDENTGKLIPNKAVLHLQEPQAKELADVLKSKTWKIANVEERTSERKPYAPFITSTLQQEANRKLRFSARHTMRIAQNLYESGHITYMRTDSTQLSKEALDAVRTTVLERYGEAFISSKPRLYTSKSKNAQEAHEAIRPSGTGMKTKDELGLKGDEGALYDLIWKRTVASQMSNAVIRSSTVTIETKNGDVATFKAYGKTIDFPGFYRAYVEGNDDPEAALEDQDNPLPILKEGDVVNCKSLEATEHETKPPARFTEASLVQKLEAEGIGRPSTYATIIDTIISRGYARKNGNQLVPTFTAFATTKLLEDYFSRMVDIGFTAEMEQVLDDISIGDKKALPFLKDLYEGDRGLAEKVKKGIETIDPKAVSTIEAKKWNPYNIRVGKFGPYVEQEIAGERITAQVPDEFLPSEIEASDLEVLLQNKEVGEAPLGFHPETHVPVFAKQGPYGNYVQLGDDNEKKPKRISLPKGVALEDVSFEKALEYLKLPRELGINPETGKKIVTHIGRFGPYVQQERTFASLTKDDNVLTIDLKRALALLATKEKKSEPLKVLGTHPETGDPIEVWDGRYGPYVKHQRTNATLPKDVSPTQVTLEQAISLIEEKAKQKSQRRRRK